MQISLSIQITDKTKYLNLYDVITAGARLTPVAAPAGATPGFIYDGVAGAGHGALLPQECQEVLIQADPTNGAAYIFVGDANLSSSNMGAKLGAGDNLTRRAQGNGISLVSYKIGTDTDNSWLNVIIEVL